MWLNIHQVEKMYQTEVLDLNETCVSLSYYFKEVSLLNGDLTNLTTVTNDVSPDPPLYTLSLTWYARQVIKYLLTDSLMEQAMLLPGDYWLSAKSEAEMLQEVLVFLEPFVT